LIRLTNAVREDPRQGMPELQRQITADRSRRFDDLCTDLGRDPPTIRHQVVCFPPLTPWQSVQYFTDMVGRFRRIGIDEFVLYWPQTWRDRPSERTVFDEVTHTVMPAMRAIS
jgi:hypothetical protein